MTTASVRSLTFSRKRIALTWHFTVASVMCKLAAMSLLLFPLASRESTSCSLALSSESGIREAKARATGGGRKRLLDVGCGTGEFPRFMAARGWEVEYDKPAYNETYAASFTFTKPKDTKDKP